MRQLSSIAFCLYCFFDKSIYKKKKLICPLRQLFRRISTSSNISLRSEKVVQLKCSADRICLILRGIKGKKKEMKKNYLAESRVPRKRSRKVIYQKKFNYFIYLLINPFIYFNFILLVHCMLGVGVTFCKG